MALIKEVNTEYGVKANYWRVDNIAIDKAKKEANFVLCLYLNKEAKNFFEYKVIITFDRDNKEEIFNKYFGEESGYRDIYHACYECSKEIEPFFADAEDDEEEKLYKESLKKKLKR